MERRRFKRFPIMRNMGIPLEAIIEGSDEKQQMPFFLFDLSGGGMGIMSFVPLKTNQRLRIKLNLPGLKTNAIEGRVVWVLPKENTWRLGIEFTKISKEDFEMINSMAQDYSNCEYKLSLGFKEVCNKKCRYFQLCTKEQKAK